MSSKPVEYSRVIWGQHKNQKSRRIPAAFAVFEETLGWRG
jgi:hypothetical protein